MTMSIKLSAVTWIVEESEATPRMNVMFMMLLPMALPSDKPLSPFFAATILVTSSGSEVPTETIVSPTSVSDMPHVWAIHVALSTTRLPPRMMPATPTQIRATLLGTGMIFASSSSLFSFGSCALVSRTSETMYTVSKTRKQTPLIQLSRWLKTASKRTNVMRMFQSKSRLTICRSIRNGRMSAEQPTTTRVLKMLLPMTLERASSLLPASEAVTETLSSGSEVPSATIVKPTIKVGM